jgi:predicted GNAT family N-acyltransferase
VSPELRLAGPADLAAVYGLRHEVFVLEQGVPADMEIDADDEVAAHVVALDGGRVVGTGRLVAPATAGAAAVIGRLAVTASARGHGVGAAVLALLESTAHARGWRQVELHAQVDATGFYDRAGYQRTGDLYLEAGIEHVTMVKDL